ncbi:MAG: LytTR family DNA-binding domain-containing protein [Chitinophagaceae bacterium]
MISAIIIDDEQHCISRLQELLKESFSRQVHVIGTYRDYEEGIKAITQHTPQLVFLDVQLQNRTGFDLLKEVSPVSFHVIFTTAHEQYAVQAFRFSAIDYLLKPVDKTDLGEAIEKLNARLSKEDIAARFDALFHNIKNTSPRLCIPVLNGFELIQVSDIIRCESDINYTTLFLKNKEKLVVAKTLKEFEQMLSGQGFFRVHNSHLINLSYVKSYHKGKGGNVSLLDNTTIEVSTRRKDELLKLLTGKHG